MQRQGAGDVTCDVGRDHLVGLRAEQVSRHADDADSADRQKGQRDLVVAGVVRQISARQHPRGLGKITLGVLDGDDALVLGEPYQRLGRDGRPGPAGDVVEHDRERRRIGGSGEVRDQAGLGRLVVVGRDDKQAVDTVFLPRRGPLDGGAVRCADGSPIGRFTDSFDDAGAPLLSGRSLCCDSPVVP